MRASHNAATVWHAEGTTTCRACLLLGACGLAARQRVLRCEKKQYTQSRLFGCVVIFFMRHSRSRSVNYHYEPNRVKGTLQQPRAQNKTRRVSTYTNAPIPFGAIVRLHSPALRGRAVRRPRRGRRKPPPHECCTRGGRNRPTPSLPHGREGVGRLRPPRVQHS